MEVLEVLSYLVTILGFPAAIGVFIFEQRKQRAAGISQLHRQLSEEYDNFLRLALANADLLLFRNSVDAEAFTEEQRERRDILFRMLVSLFEKAFIILYHDAMEGEAKRRWQSWEDDMSEWCERDDFREQLPRLLEGEDDAFSRHILAISAMADEAESQARARTQNPP